MNREVAWLPVYKTLKETDMEAKRVEKTDCIERVLITPEVTEMSDRDLAIAVEEVIEALVPWPRSLRIVSQLVRRWQEAKEDYRRQQ